MEKARGKPADRSDSSAASEAFRKKTKDPAWLGRLRQKLLRLQKEDPDIYPLF